MIRALVQAVDIHLLIHIDVQGKEPQRTQQQLVERALIESGVLSGDGSRSETSPNDAPSASVQPRPSKVLPHKALFHSTEAGKVAIVRQLRPILHLDSSEASLGTLAPHVKNQTRITGGGENSNSAASAGAGPPRPLWKEISKMDFLQSAR